MNRPERWRVEPGDAIGIAVRIPADKVDLVMNLFKPIVKPSDLLSPTDQPTYYITTGIGSHNGRTTLHKFVNVISDAPPWVKETPALGTLIWVGAHHRSTNRLFWRHGFREGHATIKLDVSKDFRSARARITTNGYTLEVEAKFPKEGEYWESLPMHLCSTDPRTRIVVLGDEWGVRHNGTGVVSIRRKSGRVEPFEAYVGLDTQLGWDYTL